ncbi:Fic family protein [Ligilactobacillus faecis]|uniref:Fic family protein n=1 Tax=Ligilactobacillus faecis TaxID=762833 RepID=UPI0024696436|nr:Fic family protein [Ligilactobacillus faecis]WGN88974.1 Fic family protein [Ligilactobacillus faecis]
MQLVQALALNESVQSTRIEGTQVTFADMIDDVAKRNKRSEVLEVTNYQKALELGIDLIQANNPITSRMIRRLHSELMSNNARGTTSSAGEFRKVPNFIGPTNKIEDAVYIPIDANLIPEYITNLEYYINGESHRTLKRSISSNETLLDSTTNPLLKIGIIHAQFESIHPFLDGNGRMGRILIVLAAMLFGVTDYPIFFVSEQLEKQRIRYYNALNGVRGADPDWYTWLDFFISAVDLMTDELLSKLKRIDDLARKGMQLIGDKSTIKRIWLAMNHMLPFKK